MLHSYSLVDGWRIGYLKRSMIFVTVAIVLTESSYNNWMSESIVAAPINAAIANSTNYNNGAVFAAFASS